MMKTPAFVFSLACALACAVLPEAHAAMYALNPDAADARVVNPNNGNPITISDQTNYAARIGEQNDPGGSCYVVPFLLPTLAVGDTGFTDASLRTQLFALDNSNANIGNVDLYGLGVRTSNQPLTTDYYQGTNDTANTLLQAGYLVPTSPLRTSGDTGPFITSSASGNAAIVNYLNSVDPLGVNAGQYVFFRLSYTVNPIPNGNDDYTLLTEDAGGANEKPLLSLTGGVVLPVPEPSTFVLMGLGGVALVGYRARRK